MGNEYFCPMLTPTDSLPCRFYVNPSKSWEPGFCKQNTRFFCTEAMKHKLPSFSYSSVTDFIHCKMRYFYRVIQALQVKPQHLPEAMKFGRAWDGFIRSRFEEEYDHLSVIQELQMTPEQMARITALMRAYQELEVKSNKDGFLSCQYEISVPLGVRCNIRGFIDRAYEDYIVESKTSSNPDFYFQKENIQYQLSTYFLGNDGWDYAILEVVRIPRITSKSEDDHEKLEARLYGDILSRPSHYFIGWNRQEKTFGRKFWRSEFDLHEMLRTYKFVYQDIRRTVIENSWYSNRLVCHVPAPCPYLPIERTGVVSEEIYQQGAKPIIMWKGGEPE